MDMCFSYETKEGCLSLEGVRKTTRYQNIEIEYMDRKRGVSGISFWPVQ
jgi:peptide deformylase